MAEVSFGKEIDLLKLGKGETFHGEGILAVTKALLQSGVTYVGGYQGAPVSHLLDVMVEAKELMGDLGVNVQSCTNEASAAAMLGASIMYPVRGAVTWKSIVGTNVAADALSNLSSPGVMGGALIVVGEDYGEGASVIQERTHAFAMKSTMWLMDPRPNLTTIVRMVEKSFELSEASNAPVIMELRIRACHARGAFEASDNVAPKISARELQKMPAEFLYDRLAHPPVTYRHEKLKFDVRMPAARKFIADHKLNEVFGGKHDDVGLIIQGGLYNGLIRALQELGLADIYGRTEIPILALNVVYPLVPDEIVKFAAGRKAVVVIEEGQPEYIEHEIGAILRRADLNTVLHGKDIFPQAGEYTLEVLVAGLLKLLPRYLPALDLGRGSAFVDEIAGLRAKAQSALVGPLPPRPPGFCVGCPERPVFAALKLAERQVGKVHVSADIGCHAFATFEPFSFGNSILGYGMSLASSAGVQGFSEKRPIAIMGDGGFWHNGLLSGVTSSLLNHGDQILVIMKNGYTSATGTQDVLSTPGPQAQASASGASSVNTDLTIENTLKGMGVKWLRTVDNYRVGDMRKTIVEAMRTPFNGLKVIIAEGECQLERQRRLRPVRARLLGQGKRVVRERFGVDEDTCTGDHSCIRLSGCPTLTVKPSSDPLKTDPVAHVTNGCVGCGLCGANAHAATLCPSFYRAEIVTNPSWFDRAKSGFRRALTRTA
ncbi:indolepyruvate ferredoxin oxidoreductase subunit alpha [Roseiarcaceae bacterium H3SJ34-1]|uniref:thiamine pyrophosphate-dependent enzyme n=1 Tax=Terripilifer ovatus TaxID=3032367 RepID=UPI003AB94C45|nr:indolepyruvate ferredoxin oxidoreductase subunit alpha [Roseiarcaceae bacterium H3SJ34-1]